MGLLLIWINSQIVVSKVSLFLLSINMKHSSGQFIEDISKIINQEIVNSVWSLQFSLSFFS